LNSHSLTHWQTFQLPETQRAACVACYEFGYHHTDKKGNPIWIDRVGHADLITLKKNITDEDFLRWHVLGWEECLEEKYPACSSESGENGIEKNLAILDLNGLAIADAMDSSVQSLIRDICAIDGTHYPSMTK